MLSKRRLNSAEGPSFRWAAATSLLLLLAAPAPPAQADYLDLIPTLAVKQVYNDNIYYSAHKTGDFISTVAPGVELMNKTERSETHCTGSLQGVEFWQEGFTSLDYTLLGSTQYQLTARSKLSASAEFDRSSTPGQMAGPVVLLPDTVRSYRQKYSLQEDYRINERNSLTAAYTYSLFDYSTLVPSTPPPSSGGGGNPATPPPPPPPPPSGGGGHTPQSHPQDVFPLSGSDAKIHGPSLSLTHGFDELTTGSLRGAFTQFLYQYSTVNNYELTAGLSRSLNEKWNLSLSAGGRFTTSSFTEKVRTYQDYPLSYTDQLQNGYDRSLGWVGQCALGYTGEVGGGTLSVYRDIYQGSGSANQVTGVSLSATHRFSYELQGNLSAGYQWNHGSSGEFGGQAVDQQVVNFSAGLHYDLTKDTFLEGGYALSSAWLGGAYVNQNSVTLNLVIRYPFNDRRI